MSHVHRKIPSTATLTSSLPRGWLEFPHKVEDRSTMLEALQMSDRADERKRELAFRLAAMKEKLHGSKTGVSPATHDAVDEVVIEGASGIARAVLETHPHPSMSEPFQQPPNDPLSDTLPERQVDDVPHYPYSPVIGSHSEFIKLLRESFELDQLDMICQRLSGGPV